MGISSTLIERKKFSSDSRLPLIHTPKQSGKLDSKPISSKKPILIPYYYGPDPAILSQCPPFFPRDALLTHNANEQIDLILENEQEKIVFIQMLQQYFCNLPTLDLQIFHSPGFNPFFESHPIVRLPASSFKDLKGLRILAVDGGMGVRRQLGIEITVLKVAVVIYEFQSNGNPQVSYFQLIPGQENYQLFTDMHYISDQRSSQLAGLRRQIAENALLLHYFHKDQAPPDLIILDGSLLPPPPPLMLEEDPKILDAYMLCLRTYYDLFRLCYQRRILLVGSVKDTITDSFRNLLNRGFPTYLRKYPEMAPFYDVQYRQIFQRFTDVELIYKLLPDNTRTTVFRYDIEHPLEESFKIVCNKPDYNENTQSQSIDPEKNLKIYASYFQFGQLDIPLRIEFLAKDDLSEIESRIQLISRIIPPISRPNPTCTIPIPQIEAHLRVHLREQEMDLFVNQLHREFKIRQIGLWHIKQQGKPVLSEDFSSSTGPIFDGSDDFKSLYSTFLPNRHDRFPF